MGRILVVDHDVNLRRTLLSTLLTDHHEVTQVAGSDEARTSLATNSFDVVFIAQKALHSEALELLAAVRQADPTVSVVLLTDGDSPDPVVQSMPPGTFAFLSQPLQSEMIRLTARRACEHTALLRENQRLKDATLLPENVPEISGESAAIKAVREKIARLAPTGATVLITGETGTGKELLARAIHRSSPRSSMPFIAVNCAVADETWLEAQLFGHEKAGIGKPGWFEAANHGSLFLDEPGALSSTAQAKLLRILMDGHLLRVGAGESRNIDVRVLAATRGDLRHSVREGRFREDLYYRLAVVSIQAPPLRDRREDIPGLCQLFSVQAAAELKLPIRQVTAPALDSLQHYQFPGNIRELRNLIDRAYMLSSGSELAASDFPLAPVPPGNSNGGAQHVMVPVPASGLPPSFDLSAFLDQTEKELIVRTLATTHGAQAEAARRLGLSRSALAYKLTKYRIREQPHT